MRPDLSIENYQDGKAYMLRSESEAGRLWIEKHLPPSAAGKYNIIVVRPQDLGAVFGQAQSDRLTIWPRLTEADGKAA